MPTLTKVGSFTAISRFFVFSRYQAGAPLTEGVEVALDPSELELDPAAMQARLVDMLRQKVLLLWSFFVTRSG